MNGVYSICGIEKACKSDIRVMWLLQNQPAPDRAIVSRFQNSRLGEVMEVLFYQLANKLLQLGEISYQSIFADGTKIEVDANRYSFVWAKAVQTNQAKLKARSKMKKRLLQPTHDHLQQPHKHIKSSNYKMILIKSDDSLVTQL